MTFKAESYQRYRPHYPEELFAFLATLVPPSAHVWDCACGSGQATVNLANYFEKIDASDRDPEQLKRAPKRENIAYHCWSAEKTELEAHSCDLITVAQALHWFDHARFYEEVERVLKPGGVFAAWCYQLCSITPEIDAVLRDYYNSLKWAKERKHIDEAYATLPFPFEKKEHVTFTMTEEWDLAQFLEYLRTWSAYQEEGDFTKVWGAPEKKRRVTWPIHLLVGEVA